MESSALTATEMNQILEMNKAVQDTIKDIVAYKKGQSKLYAKFYEAQRQLKQLEEQYALRRLTEVEKSFFNIDTTDIFYRK